jgi:mono/diheme cytochrome c family protein
MTTTTAAARAALRRIATPAAAAALALAAFTLVDCDQLMPSRSPGERLYRKHCAECHGLDAAGNTPRYMGNPYADLRDNIWKRGGDPVAMERIIRAGVFGEMPANPELTTEEVRSIVDHVRVLRGEKQPEPAR